MPKSNEEIWGDRADRYGSSFTRHPVLWVGGGIIALVVFVGAIGFVADWFNAGKDIVSPANVKAQYGAVISDYNGLKKAAQNACAAQKENQGDAERDPTLLENPSFAYDAQYRRIEVDYNRRQNNIFEAKAVGPKGYPRVAPELKEMQAEVC